MFIFWMALLLPILAASAAILVMHERYILREQTPRQRRERRITHWIPMAAQFLVLVVLAFGLWPIDPLVAYASAVLGAQSTWTGLHYYLRRNVYLKHWARPDPDWLLVPKGLVVLLLKGWDEPAELKQAYEQGRPYQLGHNRQFFLKRGERKVVKVPKGPRRYKLVIYQNFMGNPVKVQFWKVWLLATRRRG